MNFYEYLPHEYSYALYLADIYDLYPFDSMIHNMVSERYPRDEDFDSAADFDSAIEEDEDLSSAEVQICFGSFGDSDPSTFNSASITSIQPTIDGFTIKIGEIACVLVDSSCNFDSAFSSSIENEKLKNLDLLNQDILNQEAKVEEKLQKFKTQTSNHTVLSEIPFSAIDRFVDVFIEQDSISSRLGSIEHSLAVIVEVSKSCNSIFSVSAANHFERLDLFGILDTVFDPGGTNSFRSSLFTSTVFSMTFYLLFLAMMLSLHYHSLKSSHFVFDPGGNQLISVFFYELMI
ncbi:unnamed protein product [Trifolium pratense]|uniref:Uncharacterized protein n=1 Tax=Trifolium pratense TaxID=57577 RepID=A0ACB0IXX2_TRIPR|nr:unnamed protein product [Trifolium pratense]